MTVDGFSMHFNVQDHADNPGLLRQQMTSRLAAVDANGAPALGNYDAKAGSFEVESFAIRASFAEWMDREAGFSRSDVAD